MYKNEYTNKRGKRESVTPKSQCERQDKRKVKKNKYDFKEICEAAVHYGFCYCYLCGQPIESWQDWNIDHIHPVSRGGTTVPENLRPVHCDCNQAKQHLTLDEFRRIQNLCKNR